MHGLQTIKKLNAKQLDQLKIATGEPVTIHDSREGTSVDVTVGSNDPQLGYFVAGGLRFNKATGESLGEDYILRATPRGEVPESVDEKFVRLNDAGHIEHDTEQQFAVG